MDVFVAIEVKQAFSLKPEHLLSSSSLGCVLETFTAVRHKHGVSMVTDLHASQMGLSLHVPVKPLDLFSLSQYNQSI